MDIKLKQCPFCGGKAEMMGDQYPYVECQECAVGFTANHSYEFDHDDAAKMWNRRAGDSAQGAEPVAKYSFYLGSGIRFFPLDAFEGLPKGTGYLYTQPAAKVPEELAAHIRKMIELHERRSVVLSIHMQELEELLDTTPQQSGEWVRCGDRLPTEDDADCSGEVWVFDLALGVAAEYYENVGNVPDYAYWMPTGLKRPNPPKQEGDV